MKNAMALLQMLLAGHQPIDGDVALLTQLRDAGCDLSSHLQQGTTLNDAGLGVWADYLHHRDGDASRIIEVYQQTASTQDLVRRIIERSPAQADGALTIADEQTAGRGRLGRKWLAPAGTALTFSRAVVSREIGVDCLTLAGAVATARAIEAATPTPIDLRIKWPNDILVDGRKLAGILVESFEVNGASAAVIGVGINVSLQPDQLPADVRDTATSLIACGQRVHRLRLLAEIVAQTDAALRAADLTDLVDQWRQRSTLLGHDVTLQTNGERLDGHVLDLDPTAGLIVRTHDGTIRHLHAATTTVLP